MLYAILADLIVLVHFLFIVFVCLGGLLSYRWPRLLWLHLPAVLWGVLIELFGWACPLTPVENWLRSQAEEAVYGVGFIEHYLGPVIYPMGLTHQLQLWLAGGVIVINLLVYFRFIKARLINHVRD
jgi:hypothetical protein